MGKPRQSKEQFIKSRETARAAETKAAEAKRMQDEALARRNINRTRLDLYRNKLRQQPAQPGMAANPIGRIEARLPQPPIPGMATNTIGKRELLQQPAQPGMATNLAQQDNVQKFNLGGIVQPFADPNMNNFENSFSKPTPVLLSNTPYTEKSTPMREDTRFLTYKDGLNDFDPNKKEIPLVASPEERKSQQAIAPVAYEDKYGGFGGSGKTAEELKEPTPAAPAAPAAKKEEEGNGLEALKALAGAMKPKEELPATQYRAFSVNSNDDRTDSTEIKDVMSARREALMKMMGGR
jgi:hypothetical protein